MTDWDASLAALERRLARQGTRARALAPRSRAAYLGDARRVARWLASRGLRGPEQVTPTALEAAFTGMAWSSATRARALTALKEWLAPYHPSGRSPADLLERPRPAPPPIPRLSVADAAAVVERPDAAPRRGPVGAALDLRDRALLELLYGSGLRRQEACDLRLDGVDFEHELVRVAGKGGRIRTVPLTEFSVRALHDWLRTGRPVIAARGRRDGAEALLFLSRSGAALDGSAVYRVVARALRDRGRAGGPHLLRHAAGTHLLAGHDGAPGAHLRVVQELLGHASLATTQRYTGVSTRAVQDALRRAHPRG